MIPSDRTAITFQGDPEHAGIRFAVLPLLAAGYLLGFALARLVLGWLLPGNASVNLFSCLAGFPLGLIAAATGEALLKRAWRSGRQLEFGPETLRLIGRDGAGDVLPLDGNLAIRTWYFKLAGYPRGGRERRARGGWFLLACQARADEGRITFFGFLPPAEAEPLIARYGIPAIDPRDVYDTSLSGRVTQPAVRPRLPAEIIAGESGPLWLAERHRWEAGLELAPADFVAALDLLTARARDR